MVMMDTNDRPRSADASTANADSKRLSQLPAGTSLIPTSRPESSAEPAVLSSSLPALSRHMSPASSPLVSSRSAVSLSGSPRARSASSSSSSWSMSGSEAAGATHSRSASAVTSPSNLTVLLKAQETVKGGNSSASTSSSSTARSSLSVSPPDSVATTRDNSAIATSDALSQDSGSEASDVEEVQEAVGEGVVDLSLLRSKRRKLEEIPSRERWRCLNEGCGREYKRTSTTSIGQHKVNCAKRPVFKARAIPMAPFMGGMASAPYLPPPTGLTQQLVWGQPRTPTLQQQAASIIQAQQLHHQAQAQQQQTQAQQLQQQQQQAMAQHHHQQQQAMVQQQQLQQQQQQHALLSQQPAPYSIVASQYAPSMPPLPPPPPSIPSPMHDPMSLNARIFFIQQQQQHQQQLQQQQQQQHQQQQQAAYAAQASQLLTSSQTRPPATPPSVPMSPVRQSQMTSPFGASAHPPAVLHAQVPMLPPPALYQPAAPATPGSAPAAVATGVPFPPAPVFPPQPPSLASAGPASTYGPLVPPHLALMRPVARRASDGSDNANPTVNQQQWQQ